MDNYAYKKKKNRVYRPYIKLKISEKFKNKTYYKFFLASTTGSKIPLKRKTKAIFKRLSLYHLFTPSGIHLSSFLAFITPFIYLLSKFSKQLTYYVLIFIFTIPWALPELSSIKRICTMGIAGYILKNIFKLKVETKYLFVIIFFIDFFLGSYQNGHISYIYSFLFLGIIYFRKETKIPLAYLLFGGQILLAFHWNQQISTLGPFLGFIFTSIFSYIFPIILSFHIFGHIQSINYAEYLIEKLFCILDKFNILALNSGTLFISLPLILCIFLLTTKKKKFIPFLAIIHTNILF